MPFMVKMLNRTVEVMWMGLATELPLASAEGMIGCMPVFETREQAEYFADGAYEIAESVITPHKLTASAVLQRRQYET